MNRIEEKKNKVERCFKYKLMPHNMRASRQSDTEAVVLKKKRVGNLRSQVLSLTIRGEFKMPKLLNMFKKQA